MVVEEEMVVVTGMIGEVEAVGTQCLGIGFAGIVDTIILQEGT
jgi:hypothetical protein